ncbi:MAG: glycosyltransferase [Lachnospiraceae bacterium]|nr:glycosyltransferase [Lachnospiraceae bacterium]
MKNVLFFTHRLTGGGAEKTVVNLVEYINRTYQDIHAYIGVVYDDETVHAQLDCVHVLKSRTTPQMSKLRKLPIIIRQASELRRLKKELNIDVCISFLPGSDFLNVLSRGKEKIMVSVRNKESFFVKNFLRKWYIQFCYARSDKIIAVSKGVKQDIVEFFCVKAEKVQVIYNPAPPKSAFGELNPEFAELAKQKRILINAGRLTEQKGQKYLLAAFQKVVSRIPEAHLVILGEGELREALESEAFRLGIKENVMFAGFVYNPMDYVDKAELFVFTSVVEGTANVLLEVLERGKLIISTDCDFGPREVLAPDTDFRKKAEKIEYAEYGILTPVIKEEKQVDILAEAMLRALQDKGIQERYNEKVKERANSFETGHIVDEWIKAINDL